MKLYSYVFLLEVPRVVGYFSIGISYLRLGI